MKKQYEHLVRAIPNNFITRWLIKRTNKWMQKCESKYMLVPRYRKPKTGFAYNSFGTIISKTDAKVPACKRAKHISLYIRHREGGRSVR
jgi:hypothetical protein